MLDQQDRNQLITELQGLGAILGGAETDSELLELLDEIEEENAAHAEAAAAYSW
jgi:hypothetical protein